MATINEEIQTVNAQGEVLAKPDFANPIAMKMDSAKKMSLADKTGNEALKREAAAEQSFADRMGGRSALVKPKLLKPEEGGSLQTSPQPRARNIGMSKSASQPVLAGESKTPKVNFPQLPTTTDAQVPVEAISLKLDAAAKQSLADRTGDIRLKQAAAAEQSLADRLGSVAATRLSLVAASRSVVIPTSPAMTPEVSPTSVPVHVPLPLPVAASAPAQTSPRSIAPMHTCSCCGHQEPFNGGASAPKKDKTEGNWRAAGTSDTGFGRKRMEKSSSVPSFVNKPAPVPHRSDAPGRWAKATDAATPVDAPKKNNQQNQRRSQQPTKGRKNSEPETTVAAPSVEIPTITAEKTPSPVQISSSEAGTPGM